MNNFQFFVLLINLEKQNALRLNFSLIFILYEILILLLHNIILKKTNNKLISETSRYERIIDDFRPFFIFVLFFKNFIIFLRKLHLSLPMIRFSQVVFDQEVINTELFSYTIICFFEHMDPSQNSSVLVEITCLNLNNFVQQNVSDNLLHFFTKLFRISFASLWSVNSIQTKSKSCISVVQVNNCLNSISINDLNNLSQKYFVVEGKLWSFIDHFQFLILIDGQVMILCQ